MKRRSPGGAFSRAGAAAARLAAVIVFAAAGAAAFAQEVASWSALIAEGGALRRQGNLALSLQTLDAAARAATTPEEAARTAGAIGATLMEARRFDEAQAQLSRAYEASNGAWRARYAADLGNLAALRKHRDDAERHYRAARALAAGDPELVATIDLNLARLAPERERLGLLRRLASELAALPDAPAKGLFLLNLGLQARALGEAGRALAYRSLAEAQRLLATSAGSRAYVEALDALAALYEDEGRADDALVLTRDALARARALPESAVADLTIDLEWRQGRLLRATREDDLALAAYQRAVDRIEAVRQDIPIEYEDGRSSFQTTLSPIYLGLIDLLLREPAPPPGARDDARLRRVIAIVELVRQTEMQDFLRDRCAVEAVQGGRDPALPPKTAVLYPVMLPDRLELLLDTGAALHRRTVGVDGKSVQSSARAFADALRNDRPSYAELAAQLYDWLVRPFADVLGDESIETLVFVPDGVLRLIPIEALHDGRRYLVDRFATATVIGMTMTSGAAPSRRLPRSLVAGMSEPGPVVAKLDAAMIERIMGTAGTTTASVAPAESRWLRSPRAAALRGGPSAPADSAQRFADLRLALALPGVKEEVDTVVTIVDGEPLLDARFTLANFQARAGSGNYRIVHIASHGVFGGSASESYIMAYDDLLTLDDLQAVLRSEKFRNNPIELLSLSACETAEGDERSPLGISGAAIKARARSVLGTLWPVNDRAATMVMERFYSDLQSGEVSKAEALRRARLDVMRTDGFERPFYWAPFILIGSWR